MSGKRSLTNIHLEKLFSNNSVESLDKQLEPKFEPKPIPFLPLAKVNAHRTEKLWKQIGQEASPDLLDTWTAEKLESFQGNIENCIGSTKIPLGIAGPLRVNGLFAQGDYPIPLATSEAALVASYHRGCTLLSLSGGATAMMLYQAVNRAPAYAFESMRGAGLFVAWAMEHFETFQQIASTTTSHGKLVDVGTTLEGNHVYLNFEFTTGDASGQNMVTIATQAICDYIQAHSPVAPLQCYVEGNLSGDKKASAQAYTSVRGRKVTAEAIIPAEILQKVVHATPRQMIDYWRMSAIGGVLSGTIGVQGHFANGLAALYIATGQDAACVAESATGITRFEQADDGALYASVTLPNIMLGTVGGGTGLPSQKAALELMGLYGTDKSNALSEVTASLVLAGELSIIAALATGDFTRAHNKLAR
ncbi:3-hydroxy-3-methylglutaryl-coenzyme A reductase [Rubritalea squalenifaciens DSM 18772]|uniref:hydroxymethylglutaryl-CoA reductase (NADPH) n=1 Tax=Rubritalea squalenifaciens DSM 18772 TaxID=1123071 RepID=A0A1M6IYK8_9BACT|nr:hydroxymethylglutaryl-CoA reductase [Rubritalea squalenifaciens]SHJ39523.1 3-hydroxy-3-methylglutaryl-coenzyme A reductase [Rubritalea squalenifaciens DSM 18772]